jgi:tRNA G18 (ribose-2'-O)-methylase SpoU
VPLRVEHVLDADDPRLADYRDVRAGGADTFVVEGRLLVAKLLASRFRVRSILATRRAFADLAPALERHAVDAPVYLADTATVHGIMGFTFHRGCLALGERAAPAPLDDLLRGGRLVVVLESVTNPDNIGGVFRNAAAFGTDAIVLAPGCGDPLYRKAVRVAMGGSLTVPFVHVADWPGALARLKAHGYTLVALTPDSGAVEIGSVALSERMGLLLGAEGDGLSAAARAVADVEATIGMAPGADSLNVATASGIALYRLCGRQARVVP